MSAVQFLVHTPRVLDLPVDVTWDLWSGPYAAIYRLLAHNGSYIRIMGDDEPTDRLNEPITLMEWGEARMQATLHCASYIVCFKNKKVLYGQPVGTRGTIQWLQACAIPHSSIKQLNDSVYTPKEPPSETRTQKRPSGAQNRKRYGAPPSRKC
jgi:hypothetical protein